MIFIKKHIFKKSNGATAVEYMLVAALLSVTCIAGFKSMGLKFTTIAKSIGDKIDN